MTLHDAIVQLLRQHARPMTTTEIAEALNRNKWYSKKDGSAITPFQIHGRTRKYAQLFQRNGSTVALIGQAMDRVSTKPAASPKAPAAIKPAPKLNSIAPDDLALLEKVLMNEKNFKLTIDADALVPHEPGLYCLRLKNGSALPPPFQQELQARNHNIIYIGIATTSLHQRLMQELRAKGHGTFFRSLGAVLGYRPPKGSLQHKASKRNYTFSAADEQAIIHWINRHLLVNWISWQGDFETFEAHLIQRHRPLLNLDKNPSALPALSALRAECVRIANEQ